MKSKFKVKASTRTSSTGKRSVVKAHVRTSYGRGKHPNSLANLKSPLGVPKNVPKPQHASLGFPDPGKPIGMNEANSATAVRSKNSNYITDAKAHYAKHFPPKKAVFSKSKTAAASPPPAPKKGISSGAKKHLKGARKAAEKAKSKPPKKAPIKFKKTKKKPKQKDQKFTQLINTVLMGARKVQYAQGRYGRKVIKGSSGF